MVARHDTRDASRVVPVTAIRFALSAHRDLLLEMLALHHQVAVLYIDENGAHAHVADTGDLRQALRSGVTTVLDMGASTKPERVLFAMRSEANLSTDMADLRSAGNPAAAPRSHPELGTDTPTVSTVEEATRFVATRHAEGADYLKIC